MLLGEGTMTFLSARVRAALAKPWLLFIILAVALVAPHRADADDRLGWHLPFDRIVVFGTSLSDPGNLYQLNGGINVAPPDFGMSGLDLLTRIPSAPYAIGDNHFSNGRTWVERFAKPLGLEASVQPAMVGSDGVASNYAIAGSRAYVTLDDHPLVQAISLGSQVDNFLADVQADIRGVPSSALYVVEMGGNDLRAVLETPARAGEIIGGAVVSIAQTIGKLHYYGARKFFVWNTPDLGSTPALRVLDVLAGPDASPKPSEAATGAAVAFNAGLATALDYVALLPDIEIVRFDAFGNVREVIRHPRRFGLRDVRNACITPLVPPYYCSDPDRHLFWDGIHPTRAGHSIIALLVAKTLVAEILQDN
jgi:phospholipase/lecithinase/hemolysin